MRFLLTQSTLFRKAAILFFIALVARGAVLVWLSITTGEQAIVFGDTTRYLTLAENTLSGAGYVYDGILETFRLPGYPAFFMFLRLLHLPLLVGSLIQIAVASGIAVWALWFARERLGLSERSAFIVGLCAALEPIQVYYSVILLPDVFFTAAFLVAFTYTLRFVEYGRIRDAVIIGSAIGIGNFIRPVMMYYAAVIAIIFVGRALMRKEELRKAIIGSIAVGAVSLAIMGPWYIRNYVHFDRFAFMAMKEYTVYVYGAASVTASLRGVSYETAKQELLAQARAEAPDPDLATFANGPYFSARAREIILPHPFLFAKIYTLGLTTFWTSGNYQYMLKAMGVVDPPSQSVSYTLLLSTEGPVAAFRSFFGKITEPFIAIALFDRLLWTALFAASIAGIFLYIRSPIGWFVLLTYAYFSATILSTIIGVEARHRYAINPILFAFAVAALGAAYRKFSRTITRV